MSAKSRSRALSGSSQIEFQSRGGRAAEGTNNKENTVSAAPLLYTGTFVSQLLEKPKKVFDRTEHCQNQLFEINV